MNDKISFKDRAEMAKEILSNKSLLTLEQAKEQVQEMKKNSTQNNKEKRAWSHILMKIRYGKQELLVNTPK